MQGLPGPPAGPPSPFPQGQPWPSLQTPGGELMAQAPLLPMQQQQQQQPLPQPPPPRPLQQPFVGSGRGRFAAEWAVPARLRPSQPNGHTSSAPGESPLGGGAEPVSNAACERVQQTSAFARRGVGMCCVLLARARERGTACSFALTVNQVPVAGAPQDTAGKQGRGQGRRGRGYRVAGRGALS